MNTLKQIAVPPIKPGIPNGKKFGFGDNLSTVILGEVIYKYSVLLYTNI
ncbi:unnamed protein product [Schistosoma mattheei]|uniref:Uncharacterized protein n=1 Tax=Schistosoma mattheei TaxID=31246 RepID=A0A183NEQ0_9TREM|nr:unnamed protein product [Schistosoma mattheei]